MKSQYRWGIAQGLFILFFVAVSFSRIFYTYGLKAGLTGPSAYIFDYAAVTLLLFGWLGYLLLSQRDVLATLRADIFDRKVWPWLLVLLAVTVAAYYPLFGHYFHREDFIWPLAAYNDPGDRSLTFYGSHYHFLPFLLVRSLFGAVPEAFAAVAMGLQFLSGVGLFYLFRRLFRDSWLSAGIVAIYLVAPAYLDATRWFFVFQGNAWIILLLAIGLYCYSFFLETRKPIYFVLGLLWAVYALKAGFVRAAPLPAAYLLLELYVFAWSGDYFKRLTAIGLRILPFAILAGLYYVLQMPQEYLDNSLPKVTPQLIAFRTVGHFAQLAPAEAYEAMMPLLRQLPMVAQARVAGYEIVYFGGLVFGLFLLACLLTIGLRRETFRPIVFGLLWFGLMLGPSMISGPQLPATVGGVDGWFAENAEYMAGSRYLQVPYIGIAIIIGTMFMAIATVLSQHQKYRLILFQGLVTLWLISLLPSVLFGHDYFVRRFSTTDRRYVESMLAYIPADGKPKLVAEVVDDTVLLHGPLRGVFLGQTTFTPFYKAGEFNFHTDTELFLQTAKTYDPAQIYLYRWNVQKKHIESVDRAVFRLEQ